MHYRFSQLTFAVMHLPFCSNQLQRHLLPGMNLVLRVLQYMGDDQLADTQGG